MLASQVAAVTATGVLLPLYVYPSAGWNDGAANWKVAFDAISATEDTDWLVVVNADSGPGGSRKPGNDDVNYITGVSQLNSYENVETVGYVRTNYGKSAMADLKANITTWSQWKTSTANDLSVSGIFFDESSDSYEYLDEAIDFARAAFDDEATIVCNFGVKAATKYYDICDVVIAFESCLNCADGPQYKGETTIAANIPQGHEAGAAIVINKFTGTSYDGKTADTTLLNSYIRTIANKGVGWAWFTSGTDYNAITVEPATIGKVGEYISKA